MDQILAKYPGHQGHQERSAHSRLFRGRRAICQCLAGLPSARRRASSRSGAAGTIRRSAPSARLRSAGPRRREGLRRQRQCPGDREHQERPHDRDGLGRQLHRRLQHGEAAGRHQEGRRRTGSRRPSKCRPCWSPRILSRSSSRSIRTRCSKSAETGSEEMRCLRPIQRGRRPSTPPFLVARGIRKVLWRRPGAQGRVADASTPARCMAWSAPTAPANRP